MSAVLAAAGLAQAAGPWWNAAWPYRRALTVEKPAKTSLDGKEIAVVTMATAGLSQDDGDDLRVTTEAGALVEHHVLQTGPGDQVRLAFELRGDGNTYYVYFGNEKVEPLRQVLDIRRGVLHEAWVNPTRGVPRKLADARKALADAKTLIGRDLRTQVALGFNPFGPQESIAQSFTGWFLAPQEGEYAFATSSHNASFLLIDDELVVDNGGPHWPQRDVAVNGKVRLRAGLHKLTMLHVSNGGNPVVVVAWKPPRAPQWSPMPPAAFAAFATAQPGGLTRYGRETFIDLAATHAGEAWLPEWYYQRYSFEARTTSLAVNTRWRWDFGDGQTSASPKVDHVYLVPGEYTIKLIGQSQAGQVTLTQRIVVTRPWDRVDSDRLDSIRDVARIVAEYDFAKLAAAANAHAVLVLAEARQGPPAIRAGEALAARPTAPPDLLGRAMPAYAEFLRAAGRGQQAADHLLAVGKAVRDPQVAARLATLAGQVLLDDLAKPAQAREVFEQVIAAHAHAAGAEAVRGARIGVGDCWRADGEGEKALAAYEAAGSRIPPEHRGEAIYRGDLARHVEAYLSEGKLHLAGEFLAQWHQDLPKDRLDGYWSWMAVRVALLQRRWSDAAREAEVLAAANRQSNYGAQLLMLGHDAALQLKQLERARAMLERVVKDFPESPLAAEASRKLDARR